MYGAIWIIITRSPVTLDFQLIFIEFFGHEFHSKFNKNQLKVEGYRRSSNNNPDSSVHFTVIDFAIARLRKCSGASYDDMPLERLYTRRTVDNLIPYESVRRDHIRFALCGLKPANRYLPNRSLEAKSSGGWVLDLLASARHTFT